MKTEVIGPSPVVGNRTTANANAMIKKAGMLLKEKASQNTKLHERLIETQDKLSAAQRRNALYDVALDGAKRGVIPGARITETVDNWAKESHDVNYYRELIRARTDLSFASAPPASNGSEKRSMDTSESVRHDSSRDHRHQKAQEAIRSALQGR